MQSHPCRSRRCFRPRILRTPSLIAVFLFAILIISLLELASRRLPLKTKGRKSSLSQSLTSRDAIKLPQTNQLLSVACSPHSPTLLQSGNHSGLIGVREVQTSLIPVPTVSSNWTTTTPPATHTLSSISITKEPPVVSTFLENSTTTKSPVGPTRSWSGGASWWPALDQLVAVTTTANLRSETQVVPSTASSLPAASFRLETIYLAPATPIVAGSRVPIQTAKSPTLEMVPGPDDTDNVYLNPTLHGDGALVLIPLDKEQPATRNSADRERKAPVVTGSMIVRPINR